MREASSCPPAIRAASWLLLTLLLLIGAGSVRAQSGDIGSFQDSLAAIDDVGQLRGMLARRAEPASPEALAEKGFVALRLWDLTEKREHVKLAEESFKQALKQDPEYAWAHYGLGLTYADGPGANPEKAGWRGAFVVDDVIARLTGRDARSKAHREFMSAVAGRPPVTRAADGLADNALTRNKRSALEDARTALVEHVRTAADRPDGWLALARIDAEVGRLFEADTALKRAIERGADPVAIARDRAAVTLRLPGRADDGARLWFDGVARMTLEQSDAYFEDIAPLLSKSEKDRWPQLTLEQRRKLLREFWDVRAGLSGLKTSERMAEHYRRLAYARSVYFRGQKFGAPSRNELRMLPFSQRSVFDDRGLIYVRHGQPEAVVGRQALINNEASTSVGDQLLTYESWAYRMPDGSHRAYHFEGTYDDMHLMRNLPCNADWFNERVGLDPRFGGLSVKCGFDLASVSADHRAFAFEALATDSDRPAFVKDLPFFFDLYTFKANEGRTSVVAAVAVPREKLNLTAVAANPAYRIDLSLILVDTVSRKVIRQDDSIALAPQRAVSNDDLFRLHVEIAVPPSPSTVQRVIVSDPSEPGVGQLYGGPFPIPDYSGSKLMLSDIVLAEPKVEGRWQRGDVSLALVPTRYFRGGSFNVFYEVYNIAQDARYTTEIEIEAIRKGAKKIKGLFGGRNSLKLSFEGVASNAHDGVMQELRRVDVPLGKGTYRIKIAVRVAGNDEVARKEQTFTIPD